MANQDNCIFCKIVKKEIPSGFVYEDKDFIVIKDIQPQAEHHVLVIPKSHFRDLAELKDPAMQSAFLNVALKVASQLGLKGHRLVINTGAEGGQTVFHLHAHLLAGSRISAEFA